MKHCISCGAVLDDDALFCKFCGAKVEQSEDSIKPEESSSGLEKDCETVTEYAPSCVEGIVLTSKDCSASVKTNSEEAPPLNAGEPILQNDGLQDHSLDCSSTAPATPTSTKKKSRTLVVACVLVAIFSVIVGMVIVGVLSKTNSSKPTNGNEQNVSTTSTSLKTSSEVIDEKAYPFDYVPSKSEVLARIKKTFENYGYDFSSYDLTTFAEATNGNGVLVGKNGWGTAMVSYSHGMVAVGFQNQALANDVFSAMFADCPNMPTPQYMIDNFDKHFVSFSENNYFADYECGVRVIKVKTTGQCSFSYSDDQVKSNWKTITFNSSAKKNDASGTTVPSNGSATATTAVVRADGGLNLRAEPSTDGQKLALIPDGKQVDVLETQNGWSKVVYNGTTGWCKSEYLVTSYSEAPNSSEISLTEDAKYDEEHEAVTDSNGPQGSADKEAESLFLKQKAGLTKATVGSTIKFGFYEQDNNASNGKEEIEWIVLEKEGDKALLISRYALDCQPYNTSYKNVTWETCSLRKWLNGTFLNAAFSSEAQNSIISATVTADKNPTYSTSPGNNTTDKVFLLSITEASKYFSSDEARTCAPTDYAIAQGAPDGFSAGGKSATWWWLRSPGYRSDYALEISDCGLVDYDGISVSDSRDAVRPAMWIDFGE